MADSDADRMHLVGGADVARLPALRAWCGTEDALLADNRRFATACTQAGVPLDLLEGPGDHDWSFWDARIVDVLEWLPLRRPTAG